MNDDNKNIESPEQVEDTAQNVEASEEASTDEAATQELETKLKTTHERLLRTAAELENLRKRARRDVEDALLRGRSDVLRELLPVMDAIDMALKNADPDSPASGVLTGVEMIRKQFLTVGNQFGLEAIDAKGKSFDPNFHEAVAQVAIEGMDAGMIAEEMRTGYTLGEKLLRASMVVVAKKSPASEAPPQAEDNTGDKEDIPAESQEPKQ